MTRLKWLIFTVFLGVFAEQSIIMNGLSNKFANDMLKDDFDCMDRPYGYYAIAQCHSNFVNKNDFDCSEKRDGRYALEKCDNKYVMCINEQRAEFTQCPAGLVYNSGAGECSSLEFCMKCDNLLQASDHIDALGKSSAAGCYEATRFHYARICRYKPNGYYTSGCRNYFYFCIDLFGVPPPKFDCPSGLYFDAKKMRCSRKETIPECATVDSLDPPNLFPSVLADDDYCKDKETGFYGVDCNRFWYSCSMGVTTKFTCPEGMFYDKENSHCAWKEDIAACRTTADSHAADNTVLDHSLASAKASSSDDTYCKNKTSGFYVEGCNSTFYSCHNGYGAKFSCLERMFFDGERIACMTRNLVRNCEHYTAFMDTVPSIIADAYCREKEDGFYGEDCSTFFYSCSSGSAYKFDCPWGTHYNKKKGHCVEKKDIAACNSTTTPVVRNDSVLQKEAPSHAEYSCKGKKNGFHGNHCSTVFYMCKNETAYKIHCSPGTIYDVDEHKCVFETTTCVNALLVEPDSHKKGYTLKPTFELLCDQVRDGYFAHGCEQHVVRCFNGTMSEIMCYRGFYYDSQRYRCDHRQNIEDCNTPRAKCEKEFEYNRRPNYHFLDMLTTTSATIDVKGKLQDFSCLDVGQYPVSKNCSQFFQVCVGNVSYSMKCPDGLVFNTKTKLCDVNSCEDEIPPETTEMLKEQGKSCANRWPIVYYSWDELVKVFCSKRKDGIYNLMECSDVYSTCANGTFKTIGCSYVEAFNPETNQCDARKNVKACDQNYIANLTLQDPIDACAYKEDGQYPTADCSQSFMICDASVRYDIKCPADLVYNAEKKHCDKRENIKLCEGVPMKTTIASTTPERKRTGCNTLEQPPTHQTYLAKWHKIRELFCHQIEDGDYTLWGCSSYYIRCVNGTFNMLQCPDELVFNPETNKCDEEDNVAMCTPHLGAGYF